MIKDQLFLICTSANKHEPLKEKVLAYLNAATKDENFCATWKVLNTNSVLHYLMFERNSQSGAEGNCKMNRNTGTPYTL